MNEKLRYRSHTIELELMEIRPQRFRWLYIIDGTHLYKSNDVLQPMHQARADALAMAFGAIHALELITTTARSANGEPSASIPSDLHLPASGKAVGSATGRSEEARRWFVLHSLQAERAGATVRCEAARFEQSRG